jgi:hypothetical protein
MKFSFIKLFSIIILLSLFISSCGIKRDPYMPGDSEIDKLKRKQQIEKIRREADRGL